MFQEDLYSHSFFVQFEPLGLGNLFWDCAISPQDLPSLIKNIDVDKFSKDIVSAWFALTLEKDNKHLSEDSVTNIDAPIWLNSHVRVGGKLVNKHELSTHGLNYVNNLLNEDGTILTHQQLITQYGNYITWMEYYALISAIPKHWYKKHDGESSRGSLYDKVKQKQKKVYICTKFY